MLAFGQRFARLVRASSEVSLERLCDLIAAEHDYDLACLAMPDGDRRFANLRKLGRLAAEFEAVRGPDIEGFVRFCDEQAALQVREGEAAIAEEGRDAIVLMTVHAAKGLEFDVVALADCGRERAARATRDILVAADGSIALRAVDPATGALTPALGYAEVALRERQAEREEARRLQYVGMTRARHHLIVSGALDAGEDTSIAYLCGGLGIDLDADAEVDVGDARLRVRIERPADPDAPPPNGAVNIECLAPDIQPVGEQLALFGQGGRTVEALPVLAPIAPAPPVPLRRLSYSALSLYRRCGYRYFAQRVLGLPEPERLGLEGAGLDPLELGDAVHLELERADGRWRDLYPHASPEDEARIGAFVAAWGESPLRARVAELVDARQRGRVRLRCRRRAPARPLRHLRPLRRRDGADRRLQDEPPARARRAGGDGHGLRRAGHDLRARGAAVGRAGGRDRLRVPRGRGGRRRAPVLGRRRPRARGRAAHGDRLDPRRPLPGPSRGRTAASARRSTCCAPARRWSGAGEGAPPAGGGDPRPPGRRASRRPHRPALVDAARAARGDDPLGPVHGCAGEPGDRDAVPALPPAGGLSGGAGGGARAR